MKLIGQDYDDCPCLSFSNCCWAFQAGHHLPCQAMIFPIRVSGFFRALLHRLHRSHLSPKNLTRGCMFNYSPQDLDSWPSIPDNYRISLKVMIIFAFAAPAVLKCRSEDENSHG